MDVIGQEFRDFNLEDSFLKSQIADAFICMVEEELAIPAPASVHLLLIFHRFESNLTSSSIEDMDDTICQGYTLVSEFASPQRLLHCSESRKRGRNTLEAIFFFLMGYKSFLLESTAEQTSNAATNLAHMVDCIRGVTFTVQDTRSRVDRKIRFPKQSVKLLTSLYDHYLDDIETLMTRVDSDNITNQKARFLNNIGILYSFINHDAQAIRYHIEAISLLEKYFKENAAKWPIYGHSMFNLGLLFTYGSMKSLDVAISCFKTAKQIYQSLENNGDNQERSDYVRSCQSLINRLESIIQMDST